ncbi:DNA-directed RNA polymerase I subunit RPA2-like [Tropilaelaps mercedesae]|uniref:DNA-directed RNA polymerase subunit beta n=1 Tax=Tropilaelaps mercedesae TaxID=418985 RepID=A0A1V9XHK2_9ACAR|nr:DNA-directed RNA polymerase I subunit RPA2-like [Tropilaelaps mercedesae]
MPVILQEHPSCARMQIENFPLQPSLKSIQDSFYGRLPKEQHGSLQEIAKAHIESFNWAMEKGLQFALNEIDPLEFMIGKSRVKIIISKAEVHQPTVSRLAGNCHVLQMYPKECRIRRVTYRGKLDLTFDWWVNGLKQEPVKRSCGEIPIMVKSRKCNLAGLNPQQTVGHGEEMEEFGGYFVVNGNEKVIRLLIMQRRNYPIAMARNGWKNRGAMFSEFGVSLRSCRRDQSGQNMVLHYLTNGTVQVMITFRKEVYFVPALLLLKALVDKSDYEIYKALTKGCENDSFYKGCITNMQRLVQNENIMTHCDAKEFIGDKFRIKMYMTDWASNAYVCDKLLDRCVCVHLDSNEDKFNLMCFMVRKLFAVAKNRCALESADSTMNQEVLLPGHIFLSVLKEKIEGLLIGVKLSIDKKVQRSGGNPNLVTVNYSFMSSAMSQAGDVTNAMNYFLSTGNLVSKTGLSLQQTSGFTIIAEKLNFWRYLAHFRCIHRGSFFMEMRTTTVRKLLPEAWGFICPVHTPDGGPCGLLLHLSSMCEIVIQQCSSAAVEAVLQSLGMIPNDSLMELDYERSYQVQLDGKCVGWVHENDIEQIHVAIRYLKVSGEADIPPTLEICVIPKTEQNSLFPGFYMFSTPARMMRPVFNNRTQTIEWIGTLEQVHMDICVISEEAHELTTHQELRETAMLSVLANQIPWPDFNQSPRNMYQCQMGKQTMGSPMHAFRNRADNKLYRLIYPQSALVRPTAYDHFKMDEYPSGTNAIVAVISYTGYDMEDAIVVNKMSVERGFKTGVVYKTETINLRKLSGDMGVQTSCVFGRKAGDSELSKFVDVDGLPYIGCKIGHGDPVCAYINLATGQLKTVKYHSTEPATIHEVKILGNDSGTDTLQQIQLTYLVDRTPMIGDKFASRAGQKGICSTLWPTESMPFTDSGMVPDIIFNPHGFPSRMTIGMVVESMAGKSAALHGYVHDASPFKFSEENPSSAYFGDLLRRAGYNYHGTERMYSGVDGREMDADIFFGVVYYQRLRHMVADKYQVRTTGPIDSLTRQPVKGRKRGGGIRFGEMERDSLLAHGTAFLLHDRLFNCSDKTLCQVCIACGSVLSPLYTKSENSVVRVWTCSDCQIAENIVVVPIPYVFRYLVAEMVSVNMKIKLDIKSLEKYRVKNY